MHFYNIDILINGYSYAGGGGGGGDCVARYVRVTSKIFMSITFEVRIKERPRKHARVPVVL
jgi:hypothetical protein